MGIYIRFACLRVSEKGAYPNSGNSNVETDDELVELGVYDLAISYKSPAASCHSKQSTPNVAAGGHPPQ